MMKRTERGYSCGESHHMATISDEDVRLMRQLYDEYNIKAAEIARKFELNYATVYRIVKRINRVFT